MQNTLLIVGGGGGALGILPRKFLKFRSFEVASGGFWGSRRLVADEDDIKKATIATSLDSCLLQSRALNCLQWTS